MCFKTKVKTPKPNTNIPAPEPVPLEDAKGVEFGSSYEDGESTKNIARIDLDEDDKDSSDTDKGDGTAKPKATDKGISTAKKFSYTTSAVRKNLSKRTKK